MSQASHDPALRNRPVTQYHLAAEGVIIVFHAETQDAMTLEYNGQLFHGDTLQREQTALGLVVSAVVEAVPALQTVILSLIVPNGNCPQDARSISISTFAVFTTARTSIGGPALVSGQLQSYKLVSLEGTAW